MQHEIHRPADIDVARDIVTDELEVAIAQVRDVVEVAGQQVVDADNTVAPVQKGFAQVGSDKAGGAGNDNSHENSSITVSMPRGGCPA